jgi:hypothetical protein
MPLVSLPKGTASNWTLEVVGGANQSLASWGFENSHLSDGSLQIGQFTAVRPTQKIEDAPICAFGARVIIRDHLGQPRLVGKRVDIDLTASGPAEHQGYRFANAWWDLGKRIYHQLWTTWTQQPGQDAVASQSYNPHLILCAGRSVGQEITNIINYAASQGVDIALGTIDANVFPPPDEVINRDCASLIAQLLAFAPDNVCWFEYPTEIGITTPIFHCRKPTSPKSLILPQVAEDFTIRARNEDVATAVAIRYERTDQLTVNGVTRDYPIVILDVAPANATGREERAVSETVQLAGGNEVFITAQLVCATLPTNFETGAAALAFWQRVFPLLADDRTRPLNPLITANSFVRLAEELGDAEVAEPVANLPRYLIAGEIAPWMTLGNGNEISWQKQVFSAKFSFDLFIDSDSAAQIAQAGRIENARDARLSAKLTATDAPAGVTTYSTRTEFAEAEQPPVGLAQYLYDRLSVLGYVGTYRKVQSECDGAVRLGDTINVTGGAAEWASMNALVQGIDEDIDTGTTTIRFGIAPGLSLGRILELLRNGRTRRRWTATEQQLSGELIQANAIEFGRATADSNSIPGLQARAYFATKEATRKILMDAGSDHQLRLEKSDNAAQYIQAQLNLTDSSVNLLGAGGTVNIRTADAFYLSIARSLSIKAVKSCDPSDPVGSNWVRLVLCSDRIRIS